MMSSAPTTGPKGTRILMIEDDTADAELVKFALREAGLPFDLRCVDNRADFLEELERGKPDIVFSDYVARSFDGLTALRLTRQRWPELPFIFIIGTLSEERAIETLKNGATDYVLKTRLSRLVPAVHRAKREAEERAERRRAEEQLRESHEQLRALSIYLQHAREEERTRIAREVHDELGQKLTGLRFDLGNLRLRLPRDQRHAQGAIQGMLAHIDNLIQAVRRISTELRPSVLDDLGLAAALEWQTHEFQSRTGLQCRIALKVRQPVNDQELNTAFFRIFQETLTNVMRHAHATKVEVRLAEDGGRLVLEVKDNGRGITESQMASSRSIGLLGMRERAALLGGELHIRGAPGKGTAVTVRIPLRRPAPNGRCEQGGTTHRRPHRGMPKVEANSRN